MKQERITRATQFDGKSLQDIFDIPCVAMICKWPEPRATIFGGKVITKPHDVHLGDWICLVVCGDITYWTVMVNEVYQRKQHP